MLLVFGFNPDALEIHLHELDQVVFAKVVLYNLLIQGFNFSKKSYIYPGELG